MALFKRFRKKRFSATFATKQVDFGSVDYTVRELSVAERLAFLEYAKDNSTALAAAWLLSVACLEFANIPTDDIVMQCGPSAINKLSEEILVLSGMDTESEGAAKKK